MLGYLAVIAFAAGTVAAFVYGPRVWWWIADAFGHAVCEEGIGVAGVVLARCRWEPPAAAWEADLVRRGMVAAREALPAMWRALGAYSVRIWLVRDPDQCVVWDGVPRTWLDVTAAAGATTRREVQLGLDWAVLATGRTRDVYVALYQRDRASDDVIVSAMLAAMAPGERDVKRWRYWEGLFADAMERR